MVDTLSHIPRVNSPQLRLIDQPPAPHTEEDTSWNFQGEDTQYSSHCLHTYLAAMIPHLARRLIDTYVPPGGTVLDPFCGGGAVLVEAVLSHRRAIGYDINDLALLVSRAKTTHIERQMLEAIGKDILANAKRYAGPAITFDKPEHVQYWFKPYMFAPLTALKVSIDQIQDERLRQLFQVLFSATVRNVSLTYRNEIRLRRMTVEEQKSFNPDVFAKFQDKLADAIVRVPTIPVDSQAQIAKLDIKNLQLPQYKDIADAIVCSPPYGDERNGVPYTQFAKNMLFWLGYTSRQIHESKNLSLGWGTRKRVAPHSRTLLDAIDRIKDYPDSVSEAVNFYADYFEALKGMTNAAKHRVMIVIGQRVLRDTVFDNGKITAELMSEIGIPVESVFLRRLPSKRLPKMRNFGAAISRETILIFKK
ncbi:MAG: hypothetical protein HYX81_00720 [Chloroflexi bacterium]|nr:hypothetical protein [Chloroflexota bacterium]